MGYIFELVLLLAISTGSESLIMGVMGVLKSLITMVGFTNFIEFFLFINAYPVLIVGFGFSFLLKPVCEIRKKRWTLFWVLFSLVVFDLILASVLGVSQLTLGQELVTRFVGLALCLLAFYTVEVSYHILSWCLFRLHVAFLGGLKAAASKAEVKAVVKTKSVKKAKVAAKPKAKAKAKTSVKATVSEKITPKAKASKNKVMPKKPVAKKVKAPEKAKVTPKKKTTVKAKTAVKSAVTPKKAVVKKKVAPKAKK
ncbi:MAG TPA: hypothetical protein VIT68_02240 [Candidatus Gracilibacteria bacterium]